MGKDFLFANVVYFFPFRSHFNKDGVLVKYIAMTIFGMKNEPTVFELRTFLSSSPKSLCEI